MLPTPEFLSTLTQTRGVLPLVGDDPAPRVYPTNNLKRLLQNLADRPKPHLLDLGRLDSHNIDWLIHKGFRVSVDDRITPLINPAVLPPEDQEGENENPPPFPLGTLEYEDGVFDGILCWDLLDYIVKEQAEEFLPRLEVILKPSGLLLAFFNFNSAAPPPPTRYRIHQEDQLEYEPLTPSTIPRRVYQNREIQNLFSRFKLINSCFLKNQMREVLVQKKVVETLLKKEPLHP